MDSYSARFGGIRRLVSAEGLKRLRSSHVCVVGLGGVGSWAVEALARSGIGRLTLVDMDDVCITNVSRQIHALTGELGKPKPEVMERRVKAINPDCRVHPLQSFFLKSTSEEILQQGFDFVVDAIDDSDMKCLLIARCRERGIRVITSGASAGRRDPTAIEVTDLAFCSHDRLLQGVRKKLRRHYGFPAADQPLGVECVISREQMVYAREDGTLCHTKEEGIDLRQDCHTGYGAASFVTGAFGLVAASRVVQHLAEPTHEPLASPHKRKSQRPTRAPADVGL
jgi:tRNA threonylcarbamoyladenosine dehydratase